MSYNLSTWPLLQMGVLPNSQGMDKSYMQLRLMKKHQTEFLERFKWNNLPPELNQDLIERIMFYRFKGAFFKFGEKFWFLPFALNGTIDSYGRYEAIKPVLFTGQYDTDKKQWDESSFLPSTMSDYQVPVAYGKFEAEENFQPAIILTNSSLDISQDILPEYQTISPFIEQLVDILVLVNIDLISSAKVYTIVARDPAQKTAIEKEFENLDARILAGKRVIVILDDGTNGEMQELKGSGEAKDSARYFQSYTSFDNLRKELIGIPNGGQFLKQEHQTDQETSSYSSNASLVLKNALRQRKEFCDLINHYYSLNVSVEINCDHDEGGIVEPEGQHSKDQRGDE